MDAAGCMTVYLSEFVFLFLFFFPSSLSVNVYPLKFLVESYSVYKLVLTAETSSGELMNMVVVFTVTIQDFHAL